MSVELVLNHMVGRKAKATRNLIFGYLNQMCVIILAFILRACFVKTLGVNYLGIEGLFNDVLGLLSVADLGINTVMIYSLYKPLAERNEEKIMAIVGYFRKVYNVIAFMVLIIGALIMPFLKYIINMDEPIKHIYLYYIISVANLSLSYVCAYKSLLLTADQKNYQINIINIMVNITRIIIQIIVIFNFERYGFYLFISLIFTLLNNIIISVWASKQYPYLNRKCSLCENEMHNITSDICAGVINKVSAAMMNATDNILISILVGTTVVGIYSNYLLVQTKILSLYTMFFVAIAASVGNLMTTDEVKKKYELFEIEQVLAFIVCSIFVPCYIGLINDFITVWLGNGYAFSEVTVLTIGVNMYLACALQPLWSYREITGMFKRTKNMMMICALINILLSILLGMKWGVTGILLASCIARVLTYVRKEPQLLFGYCFERDAKQYYVALGMNSLLVVMITAINIIISKCIRVYDWKDWLLEALILGIIDLLVAICVYKKSEGMLFLKKKLFQI